MQVALKDFLGCRGDGTHGPAFVQNQNIENIGGGVGDGVGGIFDHSEVD
jgi:hypothetical protein